MKLSTLFTALGLVVISVLGAQSALAGEGVLKCVRGELGDDNFIEISISAKAVTIEPHETSMSVPRAAVSNSGHSYSILNQRVKVYSEGTVSRATIDALIVYHPGPKTATLTYLVDGSIAESATMLECYN